MTDAVFEELERSPARRVYRVVIPAVRASQLTTARLKELGQSVRLPGFRPGKIPETVLATRYGMKARTEVLQRLAAEAVDGVLARDELAASMELVADTGDLEFRLTVTHLPELAPIDFSAIRLERLSSPDESLKEFLENHLRQQVLDHLDAMYQFPVAPPLTAREYARMRQEVDHEMTEQEQQAIAAELRQIAERRVRLGAVVAEMARRYEVVPSEDEVLRERRGGETPTQTRDRLREDRLIRLIVSKAPVTERPATSEDLD